MLSRVGSSGQARWPRSPVQHGRRPPFFVWLAGWGPVIPAGSWSASREVRLPRTFHCNTVLPLARSKTRRFDRRMRICGGKLNRDALNRAIPRRQGGARAGRGGRLTKRGGWRKLRPMHFRAARISLIITIIPGMVG